MSLPPVNLLILWLATWRLASLLANEAGPLNVFDWLRDRLGVKTDVIGQVYAENSLAEGVMCVWCNSLWFGTLWTVLYYFLPVLALWMALPLALSTLTVVLQVSVERIQNHPPVETGLMTTLSSTDKHNLLEQAKAHALRESVTG